jgi:DNA-binding response OmpR family regulator
MNKLVLNGKRVLVVNSDYDDLTILEKKILEASPNCKFEKATSYREAVEKLGLWTYDLVILDITRVWYFDLLNLALRRKFPIVMFTLLLELPELSVVSTR